MRVRVLVAAAACLATAAGAAAVSVATAWPAAAGSISAGWGWHQDRPSPRALAVARQALPANDGWAAAGAGTTGGAAADDAHVFVARTRGELVAALGGDNATNASNDEPKIIFLAGRIEANVDDSNAPLTCADYADPEYDLDAFLAAYDPAVWGRDEDPSGPLEDARVRSTRNQRERVMINVGSNTTIIGLDGAVLHGANLMVQKVSNVIIRNVEFQDAADCFPEWSPGDGDAGNWNSRYDLVSVIGATNVWVDHNSFSDGDNPDSSQPVYLGRPYQVHDGALDITKAADFVTVSYNDFSNHDKTMLIGSSNTVGADVGKLNVTIHHNRFSHTGQRVPRVRFGQVDVYNNYFVADRDTFIYAWGVGVYSQVYAQNNAVVRGAGVAADAIVYDWRGSAPGSLTEIGTMERTGHRWHAVSYLDAYNEAHEPDIDSGDWVPAYRHQAPAPAVAVPALVRHAGAGGLHS